MRPRRDETQRRGAAVPTGEGREEATPMSAWLPHALLAEPIGGRTEHADDPGALPTGATPGHIVQRAPLMEEIYAHCPQAEVAGAWHHPGQRAMVLKPPGGAKTIRPHAYPTPHAPCAASFDDPRHTPCIAVPLYSDAAHRRANASAAARRHLAQRRKNEPRPEDAWLYALAMATGAPASHSNALEGMLPVSDDGWVIEDAIDIGKDICRAWYGNIGRGPARWMTPHPKGPIGEATYDPRAGTIAIDGAHIGNVSQRVWGARCGQHRMIARWVNAQRRDRRQWNDARAAKLLRIVCRTHHIIEAAVEAIEVWKRAHAGAKVRIEDETDGEAWPSTRHRA